MKKLGFIGVGNMGRAILDGVIGSGFLRPEEIAVFDVDQGKTDELRARYGELTAAQTDRELVETCACVLLAVKPQYLAGVLPAIRPCASGKSVISIAAGWTFAMLTDILDAESGARVLRVMPNTPALVGAGYTALCEETTLTPDMFAWAKALFGTLGVAEVLPERLFDAVIAVSGSSPAYAYLFIEAMADAAVELGMPRDTAYRAAAQAVLGSAKMVLETGEHPGRLKDNVCSPGGTTIAAVRTLEERGFRGAVIDAMIACADKSKAMSRK